MRPQRHRRDGDKDQKITQVKSKLTQIFGLRFILAFRGIIFIYDLRVIGIGRGESPNQDLLPKKGIRKGIRPPK